MKKEEQIMSKSSSSSSKATASLASSSPPPRRWLWNASFEGTERGPPNVKEYMERSAYLLKPESEADMGQSLLRLPSSSSSSSLPENDCFLGRGRLDSWGVGREGGGNLPPPQVTLTENANNNDSYSPAMPGLPRCTAQCNFTGDEDDKSGCTMQVGRDNKGMAEFSQLMANPEQTTDVQ